MGYQLPCWIDNFLGGLPAPLVGRGLPWWVSSSLGGLKAMLVGRRLPWWQRAVLVARQLPWWVTNSLGGLHYRLPLSGKMTPFVRVGRELSCMMCLPPSRTKVFVFGVTRAHGKVNDENSLCSNINGGGKCRTEFLRCYGFAYYNMSRRNLSKTHARQPYCSGGDCRA